jgi:hypothetical protein
MAKLQLSVLIVAFFVVSCKKNGTGGDVTIVAFPEHHGQAIKGSTAYVKFKAKEAPSSPTTDYNLKIQGEEDENHVHIENLLRGDYYVYMVGFDSTIAQQVKGGTRVSIAKGKTGEIDVHIPVTE